jgi:hypothetical protein
MCILSLRYFDGTCSFELDDINNIYIFYHPIFNVPTITIFATALSSFTATTFMGRCFIHVCVCMGRRLLMICMCVIFVVAPTRTHPPPLNCTLLHFYPDMCAFDNCFPSPPRPRRMCILHDYDVFRVAGWIWIENGQYYTSLLAIPTPPSPNYFAHQNTCSVKTENTFRHTDLME